MNYSCNECGEKMEMEENELLCPNCGYSEDISDEEMEDYDTSEKIRVDDAALIWASNGKDEDYTFGYSEEELEDAL